MTEKLTKEEFRKRMLQASRERQEKEKRLEIDTFPKLILFGLGPIIAFGFFFGFLNYISIPTDERVTDKDLKERIENRPQYFHGYNCTKDCSGHEAGYNWAMKNNIMWKSECPNTSKSFNEGCKAWVEN